MFKKKLQNVPNHGIMIRNLIRIFYRDLYGNTKAVTYTITGGAFMGLC